MKQKIFYIGLLCIVAGGTCLLVVHYESAKASYKEKTPAIQALSATGTGTSTPLMVVATSSAELPPPAITFEVVKDTAAQERGLGGRAIIPDNYAMVFVFPKDGSYGFWMKDMLTSIDMIWVSDNGQIVGIDSDVLPQTYPSVFYPPQPVKYVLETRAGFAKERNWSIGTHISLPASVL